MNSRLAVAASLALAITGCHSTPAPTSTPNTAQPAVTPANAGSIHGVVHFDGKPPARIPIDMSMDPVCSMMGGKNLSEQFIVTNGNLANVYIYVKSGAPETSAPVGAAPVILDQKGCRYTPHVIAVQQGGRVEVRNSDATMHNINTAPTVAGNTAINVSQGPAPMAQPYTLQFPHAEAMVPVRCSMHPWMNAFVNVAPNAFFAVSDANGGFTIHGLPPGTYTLAAVHEKLGEQDLTVTVPANGTASADFRFASK